MRKISLLIMISWMSIYCFSQNVGIGTLTPAARLHVVNTASSNVAIFNGGNSLFITLAENGINRGYMGSFAGNAEDVDFGTYNTNLTGKVHLTTGNIPRLTVDADGNVGIGTATPASSALLDLNSSTMGLLLPRMTTAQRNAIVSPAKGLITFDNNSNSFWYHNGGNWKELGGNSFTADPLLVNGQTTGSINTNNIGGPHGSYDSSGFLYDSGGPGGNYGNNENYLFEILKTGQLYTILKIVSNNLEPVHDSLFFFDSEMNGDTLLASKTGTYNLFGDIRIYFRSNSSVTQSGFTIRWDKVYPPANGTYDPHQYTGWYFNQSLFSMRGGLNYNDCWNPSNSGSLSFAYGNEVIASGDYATAFGRSSRATGYASFAQGDDNIASGSYSFASGLSCDATGTIATALGIGSMASGSTTLATGNNTSAIGSNTSSFGYSTVSKSYCGMVVGQYNDSAIAANAFATNAGNRLFQVGNGTGPFARSNAMTVLQNGNIGIGTVTPTRARVEINGSASAFISTYGYLNGSASTGTAGGTNNYSLYASDRIAATEFNAFSDTRIKTRLHASDGASDLERLRQLQVTDYHFVDTISKGNREVKGFIAQQVELIYPEAVNTTTEFVPNLYCLSNIVQWDQENHQLSISICKPHGLTIGDRVRIYTDYGAKEEKVIAISNDQTFTLGGFDAPAAGMLPFQKVFVYGKEVSDFRNIDYNKIFTLGMSAIQELARENENLQQDNRQIMHSLKELQEEVAKLKKARRRK